MDLTSTPATVSNSSEFDEDDARWCYVKGQSAACVKSVTSSSTGGCDSHTLIILWDRYVQYAWQSDSAIYAYTPYTAQYM